MASSFLTVAATFTLAAQPYSSTGLPNFPKSWSVRESQHAKVEGSLVVWDGMVYNDQQNISRPHCKYCWLLQQRGTVCARSQLHPAQQIRSGLRNRQRRLILYFVCICLFFWSFMNLMNWRHASNLEPPAKLFSHRLRWRPERTNQLPFLRTKPRRPWICLLCPTWSEVRLYNI